jgi:hypothetical protein
MTFSNSGIEFRQPESEAGALPASRDCNFTVPSERDATRGKPWI